MPVGAALALMGLAALAGWIGGIATTVFAIRYAWVLWARASLNGANMHEIIAALPAPLRITCGLILAAITIVLARRVIRDNPPPGDE